jgi:diadenosine tetraphosphatase ApaH/serine/threonine PP2A family protein phosphatase
MGKVHGVIRSILRACLNGASWSIQWATSAQVLSIISQASERLAADPPLLNLTGHFTIVGDIHGDVLSLIRIFQQLGWPDSRSYLFLGDYVDRGGSSCEVLVLLYCLKILFPGNIFLLRGNHEFGSLTQLYGFRVECASKFLMKVYSEFLNSFQGLPVAAIVNDTIFCVHGGIVPELAGQIDSLEKIGEAATNVETNMLWSDPDESSEGFGSSPRGRGFLFGADVFDAFLRETGFTMMIRGHEHCGNGCAWPFGTDGRLLTVFSSVDYCGRENDGAVAVVTGNDVSIVTFPFRNKDRLRILIPYFVLEADIGGLGDLVFPTPEDTSRLYLEIF